MRSREANEEELFAKENREKVEEITEKEAEEECEPMRVAPDPGAPSAEDVEQHRAEGHVPYRSWCEWCVSGRGVGEHHKQGPKSKIPIIAFDYLLVTKNGIFNTGTV